MNILIILNLFQFLLVRLKALMNLNENPSGSDFNSYWYD